MTHPQTGSEALTYGLDKKPTSTTTLVNDNRKKLGIPKQLFQTTIKPQPIQANTAQNDWAVQRGRSSKAAQMWRAFCTKLMLSRDEDAPEFECMAETIMICHRFGGHPIDLIQLGVDNGLTAWDLGNLEKILEAMPALLEDPEDKDDDDTLSEESHGKRKRTPTPEIGGYDNKTQTEY